MAHDILVIDDEADIRELISGILADEGFETRVAGDSCTALDEIGARRPSLLVLDIWLQGSKMDGLEFLDLVNAEHPDLPVVIISGHGNIETAVSAIKRGAYDYVEKPFKADRLITIVARAIEAAELRRENRELRLRAGQANELIGRSPPLVALRQAIEKVAPTGSRVLITGPAGAGKEVAARILHGLSRRAEGPFVVLNAAAMAPERMEVELFGIEATESTGSTKSKGPQAVRNVGTFEQAHGGTLFIDEVADMPLETQAKILRVLQDQTFERVGGSATIVVDVRVVSASTRDLMAGIAEGAFREDLFHRLNVVPIKVPALKQRREDVPLLFDHFMRHMADAAGRPPRGIADDAMSVLQAHDWPGNVREFKNLVERLLIMAPGDPRSPIRADMLPPELGALPLDGVRRGDSDADFMSLPLREAREVFEREYLSAQITRFGGNVSRTAGFVGMERSALHRKLKALGVGGTDRPQELGG
ncbi:MAG TPA: sigma-54 dependent transcriptional regulator [Alphaproteobacteria bacterium]|jgi:two-component system nitrogen regulation response regulator NtrX|nr:sigma-54 dependent transcriptional regulator [Alphaproteobacteria bacterium]MDP7428857.1 sigma-54 dependent transcriptional regulator [Alphaproteobacteria bacterium]HJM49461.1 sigma-54 dependent transcriptional regulator [Alphaproteobacteria bacterium]